MNNINKMKTNQVQNNIYLSKIKYYVAIIWEQI